MKSVNQNRTYITFLALPILAIVIFLISFIVYYPSLNHDFVWDDLHYLSSNPYIQKLNWINIQWMLTTFYISNWHPLTWLSFAIDYVWQDGLYPWGFHLTNIILHGFNSIGLFLLTILLLNISRYEQFAVTFYPYNRSVLIAAFIAALLFNIHPQHVESVTWIAERKDVLCQFFILLTLFFYVFYTRKTVRAMYWYLAAFFCFLLALMSKPMAVTLPIILLLLDVYPLKRTSLLKPSNPQYEYYSWPLILLEKIPFFLLTLFSILLTLLAQTQAIISLTKLDILSRLINAIHSIFLYISKFILPIALSPLYIFPDYLLHRDWVKILILIAGFLLLTIISVYFWKKKKHYVLVTWLFYLITLSPVIGIIQVGGQSAADRYSYLPTLPFYILFGSGVTTLLFSELVNNYSRFIKPIMIAGLVFVCFIFFKLNRDQQQIWKHDFVLWNYVLKVDPANGLAHHNLAAIYFHAKKYEQALEHVQLSITYGFPSQLQQGFLAENYIRLDRLNEAIQAYKNTLNMDIANINVRRDCVNYNLGWIFAKKGQFTEALGFLEQVPKNSLEYSHAEKLAIHVAALDASQTAYNFNNTEQIPPLSVIFDSSIIQQAKLDDLLAKRSFCFSFTRRGATL